MTVAFSGTSRVTNAPAATVAPRPTFVLKQNRTRTNPACAPIVGPVIAPRCRNQRPSRCHRCRHMDGDEHVVVDGHIARQVGEIHHLADGQHDSVIDRDAPADDALVTDRALLPNAGSVTDERASRFSRRSRSRHGTSHWSPISMKRSKDGDLEMAPAPIGGFPMTEPGKTWTSRPIRTPSPSRRRDRSLSPRRSRHSERSRVRYPNLSAKGPQGLFCKSDTPNANRVVICLQSH